MSQFDAIGLGFLGFFFLVCCLISLKVSISLLEDEVSSLKSYNCKLKKRLKHVVGDFYKLSDKVDLLDSLLAVTADSTSGFIIRTNSRLDKLESQNVKKK